MRTMVFTITVAALLLGFTGCNNDADVAPKDSELKGERTAMEFTIRALRAPQTYAAPNDNNAIEAELTLKSINVLVYNKTTSGTYTLESNTVRTAGDFSLVAGTTDTYRLDPTKKVVVTTGDKKVFVAVNYTGALPTVAGSPLNDLYTLTRTGMAANELSTPVGATAPEAGFAMFSAKAEDKTIVVDETQNRMTILVKRLVAKMAVLDNIPRIGGKMISEGGELINVQFAVGNINRSIYPFQYIGTSPVSVQDVNWAAYVAGDFLSIPDYTLASTAYKAINANAAAIATMNVAYAPENTTQTYDVDGKNLTYLSVRLQYIPAFFANPDGTQKSVPTVPVTFWTATTSTGTVMYFNAESDADGYVATHSGVVKTAIPYTDGLCYFRVYLNKNGVADASTVPATTAAKFDVLRNSFYKATIKSIKAPGRPIDEGKVVENSSIDVDIDIDPWQPVDGDYDL